MQYKIGRITLTKKGYSIKSLFSHLLSYIDKEDIYIDFLITPGGFITTKINKKEKDLSLFTEKLIPKILDGYANKININTLNNLSKRIKLITLGIDGIDSTHERIIQSVCLLRLKDLKILAVTGKSYPTQYEEKMGLLEYSMQSHVIQHYNDKILILGCHDLKMFSARSIKVTKGLRRKKIKTMHSQVLRERPNIILHHPHFTDTYKTWNNEWHFIERHFKFVEHFASGIAHFTSDGSGNREKSIIKVLEKTKKGDIYEFIY